MAEPPLSLRGQSEPVERRALIISGAMMKKTNVYVDGFNLYYGCVLHSKLTNANYKWLDLAQLCRLMLPQHTINRIRYFTALVQGRPGDVHQPQRQQVYIRALMTIPELTIHYGHFLSNPVRMPIVKPPLNGPNTVEVWKTEEKGSDVNIATHLLVDGFDQDYETAVLITNDSDLVEPIRVVRDRLGLDVGILNPQLKPSRALQSVGTFWKQIRSGVLAASQFPAVLEDRHGKIRKPSEW